MTLSAWMSRGAYRLDPLDPCEPSVLRSRDATEIAQDPPMAEVKAHDVHCTVNRRRVSVGRPAGFREPPPLVHAWHHRAKAGKEAVCLGEKGCRQVAGPPRLSERGTFWPFL